MNRFSLFFLMVMVIQGCAQPPWYGNLEFLGRFPSNLSEVSGIDRDNNGNLWVIEDNGNKDKLYQIDKNARLVKGLRIDNAKNEDWEDLSIANDGTVYIGDFGNNSNTRKDLVIYKIPKAELGKKTPKAEKIKFSYPQQTKFPPKKKNLLFDSEGFFHWNGYLYVFTKNRSRPYSGKTLAYRVPDRKGEYEAEFLGELILCKDQDHCSITAADISKDGKTIALIGYGFIYMLTEFDLNDFSKFKMKTIDLNYATQIESICFWNDTTLLIADEQSKTRGRNLYRYQIKKD